MEIPRGLNEILDAMPEESWERIAPALERVSLDAGQVLVVPGQNLTRVHFPIDSIVSLICITANGDHTEVAMVGREGVVGLAALMGGGRSVHAKVVQSAGVAYRLKAELLTKEFERGGPFMHLLLRYAQSLINQMAQIAVCTRHHSIDQQLCRWLLMSLDRRSSQSLVLTHDGIAQLMGVRRETVTAAAGRLQRFGMIEYQRGRIDVLDRPAMQAHACECHRTVQREAELLKQVRR